NLNGVYLEQVEDSDRIRMVATDGHRLALVERSLGVDTSSLASGVIIPRKGLAELKRLVDEDDVDEIELAFEGNNGLARKGGVTLVMRLIDGEFPNYQQVIPKEIPHRIALETDVLVRSLRRVVILSTERARAVRLEIEDNKITLSSKNPDLGDAHEEIDVDYKGDPISIGFNARYLLDALSAMGAKEIELGIRDGLQPVQVTNSTDPECFAVIMPMRIPT
ncbi:MAG: DNA polymerase III subunit beta, partial [Myxococcota bacterium]